MKTRKCLQKGLRLASIAVKKATSYKVVKGRLNYRWCSDEFLQAKVKKEDRSVVV